MMNVNRVSRGGRLAVVLSTVLAAAIFIGCGGSGGGGGTSGTQLVGNAAVRSLAVSSYQSVGAGIGYPVQALMACAPTGSKVPLGVGSSLRSILSVASSTRPKGRSPLGQTDYIAGINLYVGDPTVAGSVVTVPFFTDSAGTQLAGSVVLNIPGGTTNYTSYPVTVGLTINVSGGNIACKGNGQIVITDATGANTITGSLTHTRTGVVENINLSLDDNFNVTGSVTLQESNATVSGTNMNGLVSGPIACNIAVSPTGISGNGTINLTTGDITMNLKTSAGNASATIDSNGDLVLSYADGTSETITSPAAASLVTSTGTTTTSTGSTGGTSTGSTGSTGNTVAYQTPVQVTAVTNNNYGFGFTGTQVTVNGDFLLNGQNTSNETAIAGYVVKGSAPTTLIPLSGGAIPYSINVLDAVGGYNGNYWTSPTAALQTFSTFATGFQQIAGPVFTSDNGIIVSGTGYFGQYSTLFSASPDVIYYSAVGQPPLRVTVPSGSGGNAQLYWMSPGGAFVGSGINGTDPATLTSVIFWSSYSAPGAIAALPPSASSIQTMVNNDTGQIAATIEGSGGFPSYYWSAPSATPVQLPGLGGMTDALLYVHGISASGIVVGEDEIDGQTGSKAVRWVNGKVQDLNTLLPSGSGWVLERALGISSNGIIVGTGKYNGAESIFTMKPSS